MANFLIIAGMRVPNEKHFRKSYGNLMR